MEKKSKKFISLGGGLLCLGGLCLIFGDQFNNPGVFRFGKVTAVIGIVLYFSGRIGVWWRK
jgi:hypothetical protein